MLSECRIDKVCPAINKFFFLVNIHFPHTSISKLELLLPPYQFNPFTNGRTAITIIVLLSTIETM